MIAEKKWITKIVEKIKFPARVLVDFWVIKIQKKLPVFYFDGKLNAGDELNKHLLRSLSGKEIYKVRTRCFRHFLPVGSIMSFSSNRSVVFGSGFISPDHPPGRVRLDEVLALRGKLSRELMRKKNGVVFKGPLGDPALLMPSVLKNSGEKKYKVGVVLHYLHKDPDLISEINERDDAVFIDVQQPIEKFLKDLLQCEYIVSSSLHGLILSDAYGIKNQWIKFCEDLKGGDFKFHDYYSTTCSPDSEPMVVADESGLLYIIESIEELASNKVYQNDLNELRAAFYSVPL